MKRSNYQTKADIRKVLVRHWIDLDGVNVNSHRDTVRISGVIRGSAQKQSLKVTSSLLEVLETEMCRVPGVSRVHFNFSNWKRSASGRWICMDTGKKLEKKKREPADKTAPTTPRSFRSRGGDGGRP